jgi:hypothetical protein
MGEEQHLDVKATLESLIPAIKNIEAGYYSVVCYFLADANKSLADAGSPYRFCSKGKARENGNMASGIYVDQIIVKEKGER